ncbi:MAG: hypothetical protein GX444_09570 [Myxococcales bacterium]|nr:hypothetical protein [Myxococcales bacterium]
MAYRIGRLLLAWWLSTFIFACSHAPDSAPVSTPIQATGLGSSGQVYAAPAPDSGCNQLCRDACEDVTAQGCNYETSASCEQDCVPGCTEGHLKQEVQDCQNGQPDQQRPHSTPTKN